MVTRNATKTNQRKVSTKKNYIATTRTWGSDKFSETKEFSDLKKAQKFAESGGSGYVINRNSGIGRTFVYETGWKKLDDSTARNLLRDMERNL